MKRAKSLLKVRVQTMTGDEPKVLDADTEGESSSPDESIDKLMEDSSVIHGTVDEVVAEERASEDSQDNFEESQRSKDQEGLEDDEGQDARPVRRERPKNPKKRTKDDPSESPLFDYLAECYERAINGKRVNLKAQLAGTLLLRLRDNGKSVLFDSSAGEVKVISSDQARKIKPDCAIEIKEDYLEQILDGDLNPQVAMLSEKIQLSGNASLAVYFFNIFAE